SVGLAEAVAQSKQTTRGFEILVARLTARQHKRFFSLCHYFANKETSTENESRHPGQNEMAGLKGKSGPPGNMNAFKHGLAAIQKRREGSIITEHEEQQSVFLGMRFNRVLLHRRIQQLLIRRPFLGNLLHKLLSRNQPLLNQELRQCVSLREA